MGYFLSLQPCQTEQQVESCWLSRSRSASSAVILRVDGEGSAQHNIIMPDRAVSTLAHSAGLKPPPARVKLNFFLVLFFLIKRKCFPNSLQASKCDLKKKKKARCNVDLVQLPPKKQVVEK